MGNNTRRTGQKAHYKKKKHRFLKFIFTFFISLFIIIFIVGAGFFMNFAKQSPKITRSKLVSSPSTSIYDKNNKLIYRTGNEDRVYVKNKDIPKMMKTALISIEDSRFYKHNGVDPVGILRAFFADIKGNSLGLQGGSTLTEQLAKTAFFSTKDSDRNLRVKAQEAWLALQIEKKYSKNQILEFYMNKVYMGSGVYGMQTASEYYFGKKLNHLPLRDIALLAGMVQSPTGYDPINNPKNANYRRNIVLKSMYQNHFISQNKAEAAANTNVQNDLSKKYRHKLLNSSPLKKKILNPYLDSVFNDLQQKGYDPKADGMKIYTNLDYNKQKYLYELANSNQSILFPNNRLQIGAAMTDCNNGKVLAELGGRKLGNSFLGLNRATQTDHSSGSTAKPILDYGPAFQYLHWPTYRIVKDLPFYYPNTKSDTNPKGIPLEDFDNKTQGNMTVRDALIQSRNIGAIRTLQDVGLNRAFRFANGLGITTPQNKVLGSGINLYISPLQEAAAYATFANGGTYYKPSYINKVVDSRGNVHKYSSQGYIAMNQGTSFMINSILKGVLTDNYGTGKSANIPGLNAAAKTGTVAYPKDLSEKLNLPAQATSDAWLTGYTKNLSLSVWTGYDHPFVGQNYMTDSEKKISQIFWKYAMEYASYGLPNDDWMQPDSIGSLDEGPNENDPSDNKINITGPGYSSDADNSNNPKYVPNVDPQTAYYFQGKNYSNKGKSDTFPDNNKYTDQTTTSSSLLYNNMDQSLYNSAQSYNGYSPYYNGQQQILR